MANLTITIEADLLRRARIRAIEQGISVNALLRDYLEAFTARTGEREQAIDRVLEASRRTRSGRRGRTWTREELHER